MILRTGYVSHAILLVINNFFEVKKGNSQKFHEARNWVNSVYQAAPKTFSDQHQDKCAYNHCNYRNNEMMHILILLQKTIHTPPVIFVILLFL